MNTEMLNKITGELTDDELDHVSGRGTTTTEQIGDAIANGFSWIPFYGQVFKLAWDTGKAIKHGGLV